MVAFLLILAVAATVGAGVYLRRSWATLPGRQRLYWALGIAAAVFVVLPLLWMGAGGTYGGWFRLLTWLTLSGLAIWGSCRIPGLRWYIRAWVFILVPVWLAAFLCAGPAREPLIRVAFAFTWPILSFPIIYGIWRAIGAGQRVFLIGMCMLFSYWWWGTLLFDLDRSVRLLTEDPSPSPTVRITKPPVRRPAATPTPRPRPRPATSPSAAPSPKPASTPRWSPAPRRPQPSTPRPAPVPTKDPNKVLESSPVP